MKPRAAVLLVPLLAAACGGLRPPPRTVPEADRLSAAERRAFLAALEDHSGGRVEAALRHLEPLLALRPLHFPSHLLRQDALRGSDPAEGLEGEYEEIAARPGEVEPVRTAAEAEVLRVRVSPLGTAERVAAYQAAAVRDPSSPWARVALALARASLAREIEAESREKALAGFALESRRIHGEAVAAAERARTEAERAVALAPGLAATHACLAHALAAAADIGFADEKAALEARGRAMEACGRALEIDPGDPRVLLERALLLRDARRRDEALADLRLAALAAPRDRGVAAERAHALEEAGFTGEALDAWTALLEDAPDWADAWMDAGSACLRVGQLERALERYARADALYAKEGGQRWRARMGIATTLAQMGIDGGRQDRIAEALAQVKAYRDEGGPDRAWVERMTWILTGEEAPPAGSPPPTAPPGAADGGRPPAGAEGPAPSGE